VRFACLCQSTADTGPHSVKEKVLPLTAEKGGDKQRRKLQDLLYSKSRLNTNRLGLAQEIR